MFFHLKLPKKFKNETLKNMEKHSVNRFTDLKYFLSLFEIFKSKKPELFITQTHNFITQKKIHLNWDSEILLEDFILSKIVKIK